MEVFRTIFRVAVMLAAIVIAYQGWQLYGPPAHRLKSVAFRIIEIAQSALRKSDQAENGKLIPASSTAPPVAVASPAAGPIMQAQALAPGKEIPPAPGLPVALAPPALATVAPAATAISADAEMPEADLLALYSRLEGLGVVEPRLATWGNGGQLYRFCCRASVGGTTSLQRHFEAIAAEPRVAVEEVVAKIEACGAAQRESADLGALLR